MRFDVAPAAGLEHVEVDGGGIVHDVGVMLAGEDEAGAAHIRGKLVDLGEGPVDGLRGIPAGRADRR